MDKYLGKSKGGTLRKGIKIQLNDLIVPSDLKIY